MPIALSDFTVSLGGVGIGARSVVSERLLSPQQLRPDRSESVWCLGSGSTSAVGRIRRSSR